jgi:ankyrin repeat protein
MTALAYAIYFNHKEATRVLLSNGAKKNLGFANDRMSPLMMAAARGHIDIVQMLVEEFKCNVCSKDKFKRTPLIIAIMNGHMKIASYLL